MGRNASLARITRWGSIPLFAASFASTAAAVTSPRATRSPLGGNGHNVTFDGRVFVIARSSGWEATVLRPQSVVREGGFVDVGGAFSTAVLVQPTVSNENALAICEPDPARAPYRCNRDGTANTNGSRDCYDVWVIDSDALAADPEKKMRRRRLRLVVADPSTARAEIDTFEWLSGMEYFGPVLRGIEPTVTRDGKLLVWQGHPSNDGHIDTLVYSYNATPCSASGWATPKSITAMNSDPQIAGRYRIAERPLRASDGSVFSPGQIFYGAYPWIFPEGEAINFTATGMPCRRWEPPEDPPGCGPRRNAFSVIGYPTNWALAHVDGEVNPDTDQTVRLFFSSPSPTRARPLPVLAGRDVWPFFGSNTANYTELVFDDGLDGNYAGFWHMNEVVTAAGELDVGRTPDVSGYFNTGALRDGAYFPGRNNGWLGKAVVLNGTGARIEVPNSASLNPVNAITVEMQLMPTVDPSCDGENNYRLILGKGNIGDGAYTLTFEDDRSLFARVKVGAQQYGVHSARVIPVGVFSHVAFTYSAQTGEMAFFIDGERTNSVVHPAGMLAGSTHPLRIGAPGVRAACPRGDGAFAGVVDEVAVSRIVRYGAAATVPDAGVPDAGVPDAGVPDAGVRDAGVGDAGVADAGVRDAGVADAGARDGGALDAGARDAGPRPQPDGGSALDAGADAGIDAGIDAGAPVPSSRDGAADGSTDPRGSRGGCSQSAPSDLHAAWFVLVWLARRRRR
jgi:hypothetical protein